MRLEVRAALAHRIEQVVDGDGELLLHFDIADGAADVALLQVVDLGDVRVEGVVVDEHRVAFDVAGVGGAEARRVGVHRHHLPRHRLGVVLQIDRVIDGLAHLRVPLQSDEPRHRAELRLRQREHVDAGLAVEALGHVARQLDVRELVVADGHEVRARHEDVRHLHQRVDEEARRHALLRLLQRFHLRLQRRVALQAAERQVPRQQHRQLGVLRHLALDDEVIALRVEPDGQPVERHLPHGPPHVLDVIDVVRHLVVGDEEEALVLVLQLEPLLERAGIVSEVQRARRPDAGEDALAVGHADLRRESRAESKSRSVNDVFLSIVAQRPHCFRLVQLDHPRRDEIHDFIAQPEQLDRARGRDVAALEEHVEPAHRLRGRAGGRSIDDCDTRQRRNARGLQQYSRRWSSSIVRSG